MGYYDEEKMKEKKYCEDGYLCYLSDNNWKYDFVENREYTMSDGEQSFLSRMIFKHLFEKMDSSYTCELPLGYNIAIKVNKKNWSEPCFFLFDVMHNPKKGGMRGYHQPYKLAEQIDKQLTFGAIYHTIGNFAPVPKTIVPKQCGPNLQLKHAHLSELWYRFLKYMQENWNNWPTKIHEKITFKEYMICSCQQFYYRELFDELYSNKNILSDETVWADYVNNWNERISKDTFNEELLSMDKLFSKETADVEEIDRMINFLIEARGRCILYLLKQ